MTEPQPGDFGLTQISGNVGKLIRVGQWLNGNGFANYEHAFVYIGGGLIVEAEPGGARVRPVTEYKDIYWSTGHFDLTGAERNTIITYAEHYVGTPYSFLDYFSIAAHRLHLWTPGLKHYIGTSKHMICSQLVSQCYDDAGIKLYDGEWPGYITPEGLYDLIR